MERFKIAEGREGKGGREGDTNLRIRENERVRSKEKKRQTLTGEHNGGGISTECILQQPSECGIPVRDVSFARPTSGRASLSECGDHVP